MYEMYESRIMYGAKLRGLGRNMEIKYNVQDPFCNKLSGPPRGISEIELRNE
jgi:hypothetical protein